MSITYRAALTAVFAFGIIPSGMVVADQAHAAEIGRVRIVQFSGDQYDVGRLGPGNIRTRQPIGLWVSPMPNWKVTTPFGKKGDMWQWKGYHTGDDYAAPTGTAIRSAAAGHVIAAGYISSAYGYGVKIRHGRGVTTLYAHMSEVHTAAGRTVKPGEEIGQVGATGNVTGPHLHFEVRLSDEPVQPFLVTRGPMRPRHELTAQPRTLR